MQDLVLYVSLFLALYFQIFILATFVEHYRSEIEVLNKSRQRKITGSNNQQLRKLDAFPSNLPSVTMLVPCFNEENTVARTIDSLLNLHYPKDKLNIVVIDDGSSDATYANAVQASSSDNARNRVEVIHKQNGGKHTAMNLAIPNVKTDIVGCLDADSYVEPDALLAMVEHFNNPNTMAVTPAMIVNQPKTFLQLVQRAEYNLGVFMKRMYGLLDSIYVTPGPFSLFRRSVFDQIGLFKKAHNTEDMEIAFRMQSMGFKIVNCPTAYVYTSTPNTLRKLIVQRTRWTYGFINNYLDYRSMIFKKNFGNLSMIILPFAVAGIFTSIYVFASMIWSTANYIYVKILQYTTIGIHPRWPHVDAFFINTDSITIIGLILLSIVIVMLSMGRRMAEGTARPSRDMVYFILTYGFIAPIWTFRAIYNTVLRKSTPWR